MKQLLRTVIVGASDSDVAPVLEQLGHYEVLHTRVGEEAELSAALGQGPWDLAVVCGPMAHPLAWVALRMRQKMELDVPFIVVSNGGGDETEVRALRACAHGFLANTELDRLSSVVDRELRARQKRQDRREIELTVAVGDARWVELLVSDRMHTLGAMAASVTHGINNPLASVIANLDLALLDASEAAEEPTFSELGQSTQQALRNAREAAERVRQLVRDLRVFAPVQEARSVPVDVRQVTEAALRIAGNEIRYRARLNEHYDDAATVLTVQSQLGHLLLDILVHRARTIQEGHVDENEMSVSVRNEQDQVVIDIADTGPPWLDANHESLPGSRQTSQKDTPIDGGAGLPVSRHLAAVLGGRLTLASKVGDRTRLRLTLPAFTQGLQPNTSCAQHPASGLRRGAILIVMDDPLAARTIRRMFESEHDVVAVDSARAALETVATGRMFDVILCEVALLTMAGTDLYAALDDVAPGQASAMVFFTGGILAPEARAFLESVPNPRVVKPFNPALLRTLVNARIL